MPAPSAVSIFLRIASARAFELTSAMRRVPSQFLVCGLPKELPIELPLGQQPNPPKPHSFFPAHVPLPQNYAHCEVWTFKEGVHVPNAKLPETVKKEFRQIMSDRSVLLHSPSL
jgi:hypothetical protein